MGKHIIYTKCESNGRNVDRSVARLARLSFLTVAFLVISVLNSVNTASIPVSVFSDGVHQQDDDSAGDNCTSEEDASNFPNDLFSLEERQHGAIAVHFLAVLYVFYAVLIICDEYFVPAIESICRGKFRSCWCT